MWSRDKRGSLLELSGKETQLLGPRYGTFVNSVFSSLSSFAFPLSFKRLFFISAPHILHLYIWLAQLNLGYPKFSSN